MQPKILTPEEVANRTMRLGASLTGMLLDYAVHGARNKYVFGERAVSVRSLLGEIRHAYGPERLPFLGTLSDCAEYFEGWGRYDNGAVFFRGSRHHDGDVTVTRNENMYRWPWEDYVRRLTMQPGQDFLDERAQQFADAKGLELVKFDRVSVIGPNEIDSGNEIILTRWAAKESPEKYKHFVAGVLVAPFSGPSILAGELMRALDVSEVGLIQVTGSNLR